MKRTLVFLLMLFLTMQVPAAQAAPSLENYSVTPATGNQAQVAWKLKGMGKLSADMQFAPNGSILLPLAGQLASVDTQGTLQWNIKIASGSIGNPACSENGLLFAPCSSSIQEIKPNGTSGWTFTVYPSAGGAKKQCLAYGQGNLYLPLASGLYILDLAGRLVSASPWAPSELHSTKVPSQYDCLACATTGSVCYVIKSVDTGQVQLSVFDARGNNLWNYGLGELKQVCMVAGDDGAIFIATEPKKAGKTSRVGLFSFASNSSRPQWQNNVYGDKLLGLSASSTGSLYLTTDGKMDVVDARTGVTQWDMSFANLASPPAVNSKTGYAYAGSSDGRLLAVDPAGKLAWDLSLDSSITREPLIDTDGFLYVVTDNGNLYRINVPEK